MRRGLVFGKFMPLHRGHQLLIDTALSQVDDLTIVVYDSRPDGRYPPMPVDKRLGWLRELYPDVEGIVALEDPEWDNPQRDDPKYAAEYAAAIEFLGHFDRSSRASLHTNASRTSWAPSMSSSTPRAR